MALSVLGSLNHGPGSLDRAAAWGRVFGMVNAAPDVINGFSHPIPEVGAHARSAVGMAGLPWRIPVEGEVLARSA